MRRAVLLWVEKACLASFCRGRKRNEGCRFAAGGRRGRAALLRRACEERGRLNFGFATLGSPSVIGGYVWKLLARQQLPIRRNRPVDERISMRRKRRRKLFCCEEYAATCDKAACAQLLCRGGHEFGRVFAMCRRVALDRALPLPSVLSRTEMIYEMIKKVLECG